MPRYGKGYEHIDDAAAAALMLLAHEPVENMGALLHNGDGYRQSNIVSQGKDQKVRGAIQVPAGSRLGALFHNHPALKHEKGSHERAKFSADDIDQARRLGVPSYISAGDRIMRYDPRTRRTEEVLAQFPIEEFLQFIALKRSRENPIAAAIIADENAKHIKVASNGR